MKIIPAVDLLDGQIVRLTQGDYDRATTYAELSFAGMAERCAAHGIERIHVVDLNGARGDEMDVNLRLVRAVMEKFPLKVQLGGGVRSVEKAARLLESGVDRVIVGTAAAADPDFLPRLKSSVPTGRIVVGADVLDGIVRIQGWKEAAPVKLDEFLSRCMEKKYHTFLITNIKLDGKMAGVEPAFYEAIVRARPGIHIIASGGVSSINDIAALSSTGVESVVVGKALYEGKISIEEIGEWNRAR